MSSEMERRLKVMSEWAKGTMVEALGVRFKELDSKRVVAEVDFHAGIKQLTGLVHAGAFASLADTIATILAVYNIDPSGRVGPDRFPLTINLSANFVGNVSSGKIVAESIPLHRGRTTMVMETKVTDGKGRLLALVRTTHLVPNRNL